jgi:hypothetical protein
MGKPEAVGIGWLYMLMIASAVVLGLSAPIVAKDHESGIAIAHVVVVCNTNLSF